MRGRPSGCVRTQLGSWAWRGLAWHGLVGHGKAVLGPAGLGKERWKARRSHEEIRGTGGSFGTHAAWQCLARQSVARPGKAVFGAASRGKAKAPLARPAHKATCGLGESNGLTRHVPAGQGAAWRGEARARERIKTIGKPVCLVGLSGLIVAWQGAARSGKARRGVARQGRESAFDSRGSS